MSTPTEQPPTIHVRAVRWYARLWRWLINKPGNGSPERPYAKLQHAVDAVPNFIPPNTVYTIDITGLGVIDGHEVEE